MFGLRFFTSYQTKCMNDAAREIYRETDLRFIGQPQTIIVRKDANGNTVPKFILAPGGDVVPNPKWFSAPNEERLLVGAMAHLKLEAPDDLHSTCP